MRAVRHRRRRVHRLELRPPRARHHRRRGHGLRRAHLRRQPRQPARRRRRPAVPLRQGRHQRPGRSRTRWPATTRSCTSRPRATSTARSSAPTTSCSTNCVGTNVVMDIARRLEVERVLHISHRRGLRLDRGRLVEGDRPARAPLAVLARRRRAPTSSRCRTTTTYGLPVVVTRSSNNFGPYQYPEKVIPLFVDQPARRQEGAAVRRRPERARLVLRRRQLRGRRPRAAQRRRSARSTTSAPATRCPTASSPTSCSRCCGADESMIEYVADRLGHDRRYSVDTAKITRARLAPAARRSTRRSAATVEWYRDNRWWWEPLKRRATDDREGPHHRRRRAARARAASTAFAGARDDVDRRRPRRARRRRPRRRAAGDHDAAARRRSCTPRRGPRSTRARPTPTGRSGSTRSAPATSPRRPAVSAPTSSTSRPTTCSTARKPSPYVEWDTPEPAVGLRPLEARRRARGSAPTRPIVRTSWVCGRHGANMVKTILRLAGEHDDAAFVDDQRGHPTFAADLAGDDPPARRRPAARASFHVTNQGAVSWFEFAQAVLAAAGLDPSGSKPITTAELDPPRPAPRPANSVLDNAALRARRYRPAPRLPRAARPPGRAALTPDLDNPDPRATFPGAAASGRVMVAMVGSAGKDNRAVSGGARSRPELQAARRPASTPCSTRYFDRAVRLAWLLAPGSRRPRRMPQPMRSPGSGRSGRRVRSTTSGPTCVSRW